MIFIFILIFYRFYAQRRQQKFVGFRKSNSGETESGCVYELLYWYITTVYVCMCVCTWLACMNEIDIYRQTAERN